MDTAVAFADTTMTDVIVVGSGLAGLVVCLRLLEQPPQLSITLLEKEAKLGVGNSIKASSGINAPNFLDDEQCRDMAVSSFRQDTLASAGQRAQPTLVEPLVQNADAALEWLRRVHHVDLSQTTQLGGHSAPRTHRPANGIPVGAAIMTRLKAALLEHPQKDRLTILTHTKATRLLWATNKETQQSRLVGVEYETTNAADNDDTDANNQTTRFQLNACHGVVLATGGYGGSATVVARYRPDLAGFATTQGPFATGDGLDLASADAKVAVVDLDQIQVHPTGFVHPDHPSDPHKFLAAEVLRGIGGILLTEDGRRFCNELGRRDEVTERILQLGDPGYDRSQANWDPTRPIPHVYLVLTAAAGDAQAPKHVQFYTSQGLLQKAQGGVAGLAPCMPGVLQDQLCTTLGEYQRAARDGGDVFGKTRFVGVPTLKDDEAYYVGKVTPVVHYCMGGVAIDPHGRVLRKQPTQDSVNAQIIPGLYACGEAAGGLHGDNRLAGNSLLDCVVYGTIVSRSIVQDASARSTTNQQQ